MQRFEHAARERQTSLNGGSFSTFERQQTENFRGSSWPVGNASRIAAISVECSAAAVRTISSPKFRKQIIENWRRDSNHDRRSSWGQLWGHLRTDDHQTTIVINKIDLHCESGSGTFQQTFREHSLAFKHDAYVKSWGSYLGMRLRPGVPSVIPLSTCGTRCRARFLRHVLAAFLGNAIGAAHADRDEGNGQGASFWPSGGQNLRNTLI